MQLGKLKPKQKTIKLFSPLGRKLNNIYKSINLKISSHHFFTEYNRILSALLIFLILVPSLLLIQSVFFPNSVEAAWYDPNWGFRERIPLTNTSGVNQTNFQTQITFDTATPIAAGKMLSSCNDIRFTSNFGKVLPYWIEPTTCNSTTTKIWIKVDSIPNGGGYMYIYYGNPSAGSPNYKTTDVFIRDMTSAAATWPLDDTTSTQSYDRVLNPSITPTRNIVLNGTFDDTSSWGVVAGLTINGGVAQFSSANTQSTNGSNAMVIGKAYLVTFTISNYSAGSFRMRLGTAAGVGTSRSSNGTFTENIIAAGSTAISMDPTGFTGNIDNITIIQVNIPPSSGTATQLLVDGNMEAAGTSSWTVVNSATLSKQTTNPHGGTQVLRVASSGVANPQANQTILTIGNVYRISGYMRGDGNAGNTPSILSAVVILGTNSTNWQPFDVVFVAATTTIALRANTSVSGQYVEFDDVAVSPDTNTRTDSILSTLDGNMEQSGTSYWTAVNSATLTKDTTSPHSGTQNLRVAYNGTNTPYVKQAALAIGKLYRLTGWFKSDGVTIPRVGIGVANSTIVTTGTTSTSWQQFDITGIASDASFFLQSNASGAGQYSEFDDVIIQEVDPLSGINTNTQGVLQVTPGASANGHLTNAYSFNGTNNLVNIYSTDLNSTLNPSEGTFVIWAKVSSSGVWTDGTTRQLFVVEADANNLFYIRKNSTNNQIQFDYAAGGTNSSGIVSSLSNTGWMQFVLTWSKSNNQVKLYLNGVQQGTTVNGLGTWAGNLLSAQTDIGSVNNVGTNPWSGLINDVHLYSRALSSTEISDLYGNGTTDRQAYYTENYQGHELIAQTSSTVTASAPATEEIGQAPAGWWKFDDGTGTTTKDSSGSGFNGTLTQSPIWQTEDQCISGKCLLFGPINFSDLGNHLNFVPTDSFTMSAWFKPTSLSFTGANNRGGIVVKGQTGSCFNYALFLTSGGALQYGSSSQVTTVASSGTIKVGNWYHVEVTYNNGTVTGYLNGTQMLSGSNTTSTCASSLKIGAGKTADTPAADAFLGFIDDVKIYKYVRSAAQVKSDFIQGAGIDGASSVEGVNQKLFSNGLVDYYKMDETSWNGTSGEAKDSSGNGNNATASCSGTGCTVPTTAVGKFGNSGSFSGVSGTSTQGLTNASFPSITSNEVTLSAWINLSSSTVDNTIIEIPQVANSMTLHVSGTNVLFRTSGTSGFGDLSSSTALSTSQWYFVTATRDINGNRKIYINGKLDTSDNNTTFWTNTTTGINIGRRNISTSNPFNGNIDDARVYNRALTADEVRELYTWAPGPVGYWRFDEGTGTTTTDFSGNSRTGTLTCGGSGCLNPIWSDKSKYGKSIYFTTTGQPLRQYVSTSVLNVPSTSASAITTETWINPDASQPNGINTGYIIRNGSGNDENYGLRLASLSGGKYSLAFEYNDGGTFRTFTTTGFYVPTNQWTHVAAIFLQGTSIKFYINGALQETLSTTFLSVQATTTLTFGGNPGSTNQALSGFLDDIRIYNYERTSEQILEDMQGDPSATQVSGSSTATKPSTAVAYWPMDEGFGTTINNAGNGGTGLTGTLTNMASPATSTSGWQVAAINCKYGKCLAFDGTNDFVNVTDNPALDTTGDLTISSWINTTNNGGTNAIIAKSAGTNATTPYMLYTSAGQPTILLGDGTTFASAVSPSTINDGKWHYVVATIQGTNITLYVDGNIKKTSTFTNGGTRQSNTNALYIGRSANSAAFFNGSMDEVKFYDSALTQDEVREEFNAGLAINYGDGTVEGNNFTNGAGNAQVADWEFDERTGSTVNDSSGNNNTGTWNGTLGSQWTVGKIDAAGNFNGNDNFVRIANSTATIFNLGTGPMTIQGWFKTTASPSGQVPLIDAKSGGSNIAGYNLNWNASGQPSFRIANGTTQQTITASVVINDGKWHFVTGTLSRGANDTLSIYVDGQFYTSINAPATGWNISTTQPLDIGQLNNNTSRFLGQIDQVKIYNYARTQDQIAFDYNRGAPIGWWKFDECQGSTAHDSSTNRLDGTITIGGTGTQTAFGNCTTSSTAWGNGVTGKFNSSLNFDGTDDFVDLGNSSVFSFSNTMSTSAWVFFKSSSTNQYIVSKDQGPSPNGWALRINGNAKLDFMVNGVLTEGNIPSLNAWHLVTGTYDGSATKLYVDGKQVATNTFSGNVFNTATDASIGSSINLGRFINAQIDDVRIYNYALTQTQIKLLYNDNFSTLYAPTTGSP